jgi:ubiquinone/menaquinone biosynthesis C-methylase UbiE
MLAQDSSALSEGYYTDLAAAFVLGRLPGMDGEMEPAAVIAAGQAAGLRLHRFKRNAELPRVRASLGVLKSLAPESLLDVGTGRGTFLWPLLEALPALPVTAVDTDPIRARDLGAVRAGGIDRLWAVRADVRHLPFPDCAFDVVTVLEVLEHLHDAERAASEVVRVARRAVVASVPSHEDNNPGHVHVLDRKRLAATFQSAGAPRVSFTAVRGHTLVIAGLGR